uniref:(northern house mosquito) hypothetical protein n=1 Tax=Culex pipiens TaxID=7175 RepID=A0A8D8BRW1_CULPI
MHFPFGKRPKNRYQHTPLALLGIIIWLVCFAAKLYNFQLFSLLFFSCFKPPSSKQPSHDCEIVKLLRFSLFIMICAHHSHTDTHSCMQPKLCKATSTKISNNNNPPVVVATTSLQ